MSALLHAMISNDLAYLSHPGMVWWIIGILFSIIFLESALLPAAFLPGDSMLLLGGVLTEKGILPFFPTALLLVMAAGCGYWLNYMTGRWLSQTATVKRWIANVPPYQYQRTINLSERYGSPVLLAGRFIGFIRTLLPLLVGISGIRSWRFHLFNWCGAGLWVYGIMMMGRSLASTVIFRQNSSLGLAVLLVSSLLLLFAGIAGSVWVMWRRNRQKGKGKIPPTTRVGR